MNYMDTALGQLAFAWKLYNYGCEGKIDFKALDVPVVFQEGVMVLSLPDQVLESEDDLMHALSNQLGIAFGAAAITLDRCRKEVGLDIPSDLDGDVNQFIGLAYQIRCAFAHDIAEPRWKIKDRFARVYEFAGIRVDLTQADGQHFTYESIGGPETMFRMAEFAAEHLWPGKASKWIHYGK